MADRLDADQLQFVEILAKLMLEHQVFKEEYSEQDFDEVITWLTKLRAQIDITIEALTDKMAEGHDADSRMNDRDRVDASVEHSHMVISWQTEDAPSDPILINEDHKYIDVPCRGSGNADAEKDKAASSI